MERNFCTLFDQNYLIKGLVMLTSLLKNCDNGIVYVLCMDHVTHDYLSKLNIKNVKLLTLAEVEDEELLRVKPGRSAAEYCWTLSAALCWYVLNQYKELESITYLDADLYFGSRIDCIFDEIGEASIAIIEHRFSPHLSHLEAYGKYNVEWVSFKRDHDGLTCLRKWREQCIEWCFARLEDGRMGDQKYLDYWPEQYPKTLHVIQHKGAGVAPWNFSNYTYNIVDNNIKVDNESFVFYHFHQFQIMKNGKFHRMSDVYVAGNIIPSMIYDLYEKEIDVALHVIRRIDPNFKSGMKSPVEVGIRHLLQKRFAIGIKNCLRRIGIQTW